MQKYQLVVRDDPFSKHIADRYQSELDKHGWERVDQPKLVIAIGGDGTMLEAFHQYYRSNVAFVGLHTGRLGFYADWDREEAEELLDHLLHAYPEFVEYPLVSIAFEQEDRTDRFLALNETVIKSKTLSTFVMEIYLNENRFQTFRGDGLIISTPSGSTGYNHSVGGSIIHPNLEAMIVSELAAINNREFRTLNRSFVLPFHHVLDIYPKNPAQDILVGIDGHEHSFAGIKRIRTKVALEKVRFARYRPFPFWQRVREKFLDD